MLVTLCFQKVNCTSSQGLVLVAVNWNSFAVSFFCTPSIPLCSSDRCGVCCFSHCNIVMILSDEDPLVFP